MPFCWRPSGASAPRGCSSWKGERRLYAYCLFCETQRCADLARLIETVHGLRCISPQIIQRKWVRGRETEERHAWLPGYIFVYAAEAVLPPLPFSGIIRCLGHGPLIGQDLAFADMIRQRDGVLGTVRLAQEGDRCTLNDPLWQGVQGTIVKLDRGRKRCCVEFVFDQVPRRVWVGYDLIEPSQTGDQD